MVTKIDLTGKQLATINSKPNVVRHSGEVTIEMDLQPIVDQIDAALK